MEGSDFSGAKASSAWYHMSFIYRTLLEPSHVFLIYFYISKPNHILSGPLWPFSSTSWPRCVSKIQPFLSVRLVFDWSKFQMSNRRSFSNISPTCCTCHRSPPKPQADQTSLNNHQKWSLAWSFLHPNSFWETPTVVTPRHQANQNLLWSPLMFFFFFQTLKAIICASFFPHCLGVVISLGVITCLPTLFLSILFTLA